MKRLEAEWREAKKKEDEASAQWSELNENIQTLNRHIAKEWDKKKNWVSERSSWDIPHGENTD